MSTTRQIRLVLMAALVGVALAASPAADRTQAAASDYVRGDLTFVTDGGRVDWSHDGETVYFDRQGADGYFDVWRMNPDGTGQTCLTCDHPQLPNRNQGNPEIHPAGRYLVFQAEKGQHDPIATYLVEPGSGRYNDLWVLDLQTNEAFPLTNVSATGFAGVLHPQFNSDGSKLLWGQIEGSGNEFADWALVVADFVASAQPYLNNAVIYNPGPDPGWMETHGWGPDDSWIYFTCTPVAGMSDGRMDTCRMDFSDPSQVTRLNLTSGENGEPAEWDEHAHLSPANDIFAWMSSQPYGVPPDASQAYLEVVADLWIMNVDGSGQQRVTYFNDPGHPDYTGERTIVSDLDWSPDGSRVVMHVQFPDSAARYRIYVLDLCADSDGNGVCDVAESPFPPDAIDVQTDTILPTDDLLFSSLRHWPTLPPGETWRADIFAMDVETLQYHRVTFMDDQAMRHMAASPDRQKLAMTRIPSDTNGDGQFNEHDDQIIWIVDLQAGKAWPLTEAGASAGVGGMDWLDNDTVIFNYKPPGPGYHDLAKANYLTKARTMLTNTPTIGETDVGASADGTLISYIAVDTNEVLGTDEFGPILKGKVWLMNADGSNPRQITDGGPIVGRAGLLGAGDYDPELSPDNTKVTFGRAVALGTNDIDPLDGVPPAGTHRIYTADVNTLAVTELTQNTSVALVPDWAPDGTIYFSEVAITAEHDPDKYLGIATTTESGGLTRLEPFPPQDIWKGALITKLIPPDGDGDGVPDASDPCPADPDCDNDSFSDGIELFIGTLPLAACPATPAADDENPDSWPPDADDDRDADVGDAIRLFGDPDGNGLNVILTPSEYAPRSDFDGDDDVDVGDLIAAFGDGRMLSSCV